MKERSNTYRMLGRKKDISRKRLIKRIAVVSHATMENIEFFHTERLLNARWKAVPIGELKEQEY